MIGLMLAAVTALAAAVELPPLGEPVKLFNGRDLDGFDVFLKSKGLNRDPEKVFRVHDRMLHISGAEFGYIVTKREFGDYYLRCEFKWGEETYPPRQGKARDSGILYHVTGEDKVWPRSIEMQMIEGGTGDIILVDEVELTRRGETRTKGRFDRFGKGPWQDVAGYRDPGDELEKPHGQWNTVEMLVDGATVHYWINGKLANEGTGAGLTKGKILFQSEGAEVFFRNIELRPLKR